MDRLRVAVLFGGCSEEHPISVKSAREVARHLDPARYEPVWVGITPLGAWLLCDGPGEGWDRRGGRPAVLVPDRRQGGLLVFDEGRFETVAVDVVLPVLHGRFGEDGAVQGLLELSGIPYVGCPIAASALCMDKSLTYLVARSVGVSTPVHTTINGFEAVDRDRYTYPVFVKPARSGSSFGVSRVARPDDLQDAMHEAWRYDTKVLVEEAVVGQEVGCAVLGNPPDLTVGEVDRIALTHGFFRIHQEDAPETGSENATPIVPADIHPAARGRVQETARTLYRALGCRGLARVDLFLQPDGAIVLNEVNTLPGLTSYSRYPRMMAAAGWSMTDVLDHLIASARTGSGR